MKKILISVFLLCLGIGGCRLGGGGTTSDSTGTGVGGGTTPPGETGTAAESLLTNPLSSVCRANNEVYFFGSNGGKLIKSANGTDFVVLDGTARDIRAVHCNWLTTPTTTTAWFVGAGGIIFRSNGSTVTEETSPVDETLNAVFGTDTSNVLAVGDSGTAVYWDGNSWTAETSGTTEHLYGASGSSGPVFWAVGAKKTVLKRASVTTWVAASDLPTDVPADTRLNAVWVDTISGQIFIIGNAGTIIKGAAGGTSWAKQTSGTSLPLRAVHGSSNNQVIAVGDDGILLSYDGTTWTAQTNPEEDVYSLYGVLSLSGTSAFAVGSDGTTSDSDGVILKLTSDGWEKWFW